MRVACTVSWREKPGVLTLVMLWPVTASEVLFAARPDRPMLSRSAMVQLSGPRGRHIDGSHSLVGLHLPGDLHDLAGVLGVGGITGRLQLAHEALRVIGRRQRFLIAAIALQEVHVVVETLPVGVVGPEGRRLLHRRATLVLGGQHPRRVALPAAMGLDAEQVVAAGAIGLADDRLAPTGLQGGLGHQVAGIDTDLLRGLLGQRQHGGDEVGGRGEGRLALGQRRLGHAAAADSIAVVQRQRLAVGHRAGLRRHPVLAGQRLRLASASASASARHYASQQAVGELARQAQAALVEQLRIVTHGSTALACRLKGAGTRTGLRWLDLGERIDPLRPALDLAELALEHRGQTDAAVVLRQGHGQLLVVHVLVGLALVAVHEVAFGEHLVRLAHGLHHLVEEQRLEFLGDLLDVARAVAADLELVEPVQVGVGAAVEAGCESGIHGRLRQITIRSACKAPACLSASRMAIRSEGAAPTWLTARTISSSVVPGPNLNIGLASCSALTLELGTTTVWPSEKGSGWLTCGSSEIVTVRLPWVTAAGCTRTFWPMTMVPVRELMITLATAWPTSTSRFSRIDR